MCVCVCVCVSGVCLVWDVKNDNPFSLESLYFQCLRRVQAWSFDSIFKTFICVNESLVDDWLVD